MKEPLVFDSIGRSGWGKALKPNCLLNICWIKTRGCSLCLHGREVKEFCEKEGNLAVLLAKSKMKASPFAKFSRRLALVGRSY